MRRTLSLLSALLMVGGIALLAWVGASYVQQRKAISSTPSWNAAERQKGKNLSQALAKRHDVKLPSKLLAKLRPGTEPGVRLVIPKIGVNAPVVETPPVNGEWLVADWAVGHLTTTPNPGAVGNVALSAHDDIKGEIFKRLDALSPGDRILLYTRHAMFSYLVVSQKAVDPSDVSVLNQTKTPTLTLISCTPYWVDTQRLIVQAVLRSEATV